LGPLQKSLIYQGLTQSLKIRADFTVSGAACQYRATLQICNEKGLAKGVAKDYILRMETQEKIVRIGNALYGEVNGMIVRFIGMVL
jgi:hypothetical protein